MPEKSDEDSLIARIKSDQPPTSGFIDPTPNVLSLVAAAMKRQDDLRESGDKWAERVRQIEDRCDREKQELREKLANAESTRIDALNLAEARRLDAVIAGGQANVALASEKAAAQSAQLATQVATTATAMASQNTAMRESLEKRLALVEQNQYATGGRDVQRGESSNSLRENIGTIVGVIGLLAALLVAFLK